MRYIHSQESLTIPENGESLIRDHLGRTSNARLTRMVVKIGIKSRIVTVEGPRGTPIDNATICTELD